MKSKRWITVMVLAALAACGKEEPKREAAPAAESVAAASASSPEPADSRPTAPDARSPATAAANAGGASTYTVKRGDTLGRIARAHGVKYRDLARWNGIEDPNRLQVGQELRVAPPEPSARR